MLKINSSPGWAVAIVSSRLAAGFVTPRASTASTNVAISEALLLERRGSD